MNREIKFRGQGYDGEWYFGSYLYDIIHKTHLILTYDIVGNIVETKVKPETVGQFTGLKDKNGKEIYGGDILDNGNGRHSHGVARVEWDKDKWKLVCSCGVYFNKFDVEYGEVIGNLYENPELVEG